MPPGQSEVQTLQVLHVGGVPKISVDDLLKQLIAKVGENIRVARFVRLKLGEQSAAEKGPTSHGSCA